MKVIPESKLLVTDSEGKYFDESTETFSVMSRPVVSAVDPEMETSKMTWAEVTDADAYNIYKLQNGEAVFVEQSRSPTPGSSLNSSRLPRR